jgi:hypothetical protein
VGRFGSPKAAIFGNSRNTGAAEEILVLLHRLGGSLNLLRRKGSPKNLAMQLQGSGGETCRQGRPGGRLGLEKVKWINVNGKTHGKSEVPPLPEGAMLSQRGIFPKLSPKILLELETPS